jgi:hypothetical protein
MPCDSELCLSIDKRLEIAQLSAESVHIGGGTIVLILIIVLIVNLVRRFPRIRLPRAMASSAVLIMSAIHATVPHLARMRDTNRLASSDTELAKVSGRFPNRTI